MYRFYEGYSPVFHEASPVRIGRHIEFFSEIDLLAGLSACPGGDCSLSHSSDDAVCYSLKVEIYECLNNDLKNWRNQKPQITVVIIKIDKFNILLCKIFKGNLMTKDKKITTLIKA